jgi:hypothetical protein
MPKSLYAPGMVMQIVAGVLRLPAGETMNTDGLR